MFILCSVKTLKKKTFYFVLGYSPLGLARWHSGQESACKLPTHQVFPTQNGISIHYLNINHTGVRRQFVHPSPIFHGEENKAPKRLQKTQRISRVT